MKIGILDSGVGGLTVLNEALQHMPDEDYIYLADTYNVPYGTKTREQVKELILNIVEFLDSKDIDVLVVACNTATSVGITELRRKYSFPVIGMEPAVKYALERNISGRVLVLATPLTLTEKKYKRLVKRVDTDERVNSLALPELVEYAERFIFDRKIILDYLADKFSLYNFAEYSAIVLGCTHFIYYRDFIKESVLDCIDIVDGNYGTIKHLKNLMKDKLDQNDSGKVEFFQSAKNGVKSVRFDKYMNLL